MLLVRARPDRTPCHGSVFISPVGPWRLALVGFDPRARALDPLLRLFDHAVEVDHARRGSVQGELESLALCFELAKQGLHPLGSSVHAKNLVARRAFRQSPDRPVSYRLARERRGS